MFLLEAVGAEVLGAGGTHVVVVRAQVAHVVSLQRIARRIARIMTGPSTVDSPPLGPVSVLISTVDSL